MNQDGTKRMVEAFPYLSARSSAAGRRGKLLRPPGSTGRGSVVALRATGFQRGVESRLSGNLPRELSSFVGRQQLVADLAAALRAAGLVTLVGVGGVGKTRLALATAAAVQAEYAQGAWLVELAPVTDARQVASAVAAALGVRERPGSEPRETLRRVLRRGEVLLILDNCEHVLQGCAELVATLVQECEKLTVLATSREQLGVAGEVLCAVLPLQVSAAEATVEQMLASDAVQLFGERARASDASFTLSPETVSVAAQICRRLDGLPLAIELAAARARTMSLLELAARLGDPLGLLTSGPRTAPQRHQTLRAAIDWSFDLLTEAEQVLLRRAAIFSSGFTVDGVTQVCCDRECPAEQVVDLLQRLVNHSFVSAATRQVHTRFDMLETVRQYALERLEQAGETTLLRERHRDWCLGLVGGGPRVAPDVSQAARLDPEMDNVRSALRWVIQTGQTRAAAGLALGMSATWLLRGSFAEGKAVLTGVLDLAAGEGTAVSEDVAHVGIWAGTLAANQGEYAESERLYLAALKLARASNNAYAELYASTQLGWLAFLRGDARRARDVHERALTRTPTGDPLAQIIRLQLVAACIELGERGRAIELLDAVTEHSHNDPRFLSGRVLKAQALLAEQMGEYGAADRLLDRSIASERVAGDQPGLIESLTLRGVVALESGDRQLATEVLAEALEIAWLFGSKMRLAHLLEALAQFAVRGQPAVCVRLAATAEQLRASLGAAPVATEQARVGRCLELAKRRLGDRAYADIWLEAQTLPLEVALSEARQTLRSPIGQDARAGAEADDDRLSVREREVAMLVARGLSNPQIADALVISRKTVETHVSHVLNKLGLTSRVQIATWAMRREDSSADRRDPG